MECRNGKVFHTSYCHHEEISHHASILKIPCSVAAGRCLLQSLSSVTPTPASVTVLSHSDTSSSHCPKSPRRQLQSVQAPQSTSRPLRSSPWPRLRFLIFFKGALLPYLNKTVELELPGRESLAAGTRVCCRSYELARLA